MTMNENMKLWKYSGTFLVITGAIHTVYALLLGKEDFTDMIKDGLINFTDDSCSRAFALCFLVCGIILILWGLTLHCIPFIYIFMGSFSFLWFILPFLIIVPFEETCIILQMKKLDLNRKGLFFAEHSVD